MKSSSNSFLNRLSFFFPRLVTAIWKIIHPASISRLNSKMPPCESLHKSLHRPLFFIFTRCFPCTYHNNYICNAIICSHIHHQLCTSNTVPDTERERKSDV
jgi:hypothetical protein